MIRYLKEFILGPHSVKRASFILIVTLTVSNLLGVVRDHFLARKIPAERLDIYYAAFRIPDLVFNLLILGAISAAFIPIFTHFLQEKKIKEAWQIANAFLSRLLLYLALALIIVYFLMPLLMEILVPSFAFDKKLETVRLARVLLLSPIFFTFSYFLGGVLNSFKRFLSYSLAPLFYNLSIIGAVVFWGQDFGVRAAVVGVLVGAFLHMLIQLPSAIRLGLRFRPIFKPHPQVRKIFTLMIPRSIGLLGNQILLFVFTALASAIPGGVAVYNLADNIQTVPIVILGTSLSTAIFPTLSEFSTPEDRSQFINYLVRAVRVALFLLIPAAVGLFLLRAQIVRLILGYGYFGWHQTIMTLQILGYFAFGVVAGGLIPLLARSFYALKNTAFPMWVALIAGVFSIILSIFFIKSLGIAGLALAFSVGSWLNFFLLYFGLDRQIGLKLSGKFYKEIFKIIILTVFMAIAIQTAKVIFGTLLDLAYVINLLTQTVLSILIGAGVYLLGAKALKLLVLEELFEFGKNKLKV